jgi:imidazolonepropionase-like amidohydrolase
MARAVVYWAGRGADFIKVLASGPVDLDRSGHVGPPQFRFEDLSYLVELAKNQGLGVMAHANGPHAVAEAVRAGAATVEHGYFMGEDNLKRLADQGIPWIPTVVPLAVLEAREPDPERQRRIGDIVRHQLDQAAQAEALGVPLILGTDAGCPGVAVGPGLYMEMSLWLSAGIRAETVLDAAVYRPAHLFGWDLDLGRLEPGSRALLTGCDAGRPLAETLSIPPLWVSRLEPAPQG